MRSMRSFLCFLGPLCASCVLLLFPLGKAVALLYAINILTRRCAVKPPSVLKLSKNSECGFYCFRCPRCTGSADGRILREAAIACI